MGGGMGAFWGTRVMELVKKHDSGGLLWKRIKLTPTRKANAKTRLRRVWQVLSYSIFRVYGFLREHFSFRSLDPLICVHFPRITRQG